MTDYRDEVDGDKWDEIDGRWIEAVNEYASTCDLCSELASHELMTMDLETQLGFCENCVEEATRRGLITCVAVEI